MKKLICAAGFLAFMSLLAYAQPQEAQKPQEETKSHVPAKQKVKKHQMTGEVVQIDAAAKQFTIKNKKGDSRTFSLSPVFKVKKDGKEIQLMEVLGGDRLFVKYKEVDGKSIATSAKIKPEKE